MEKDEVAKAYDFLIENGTATEAELQLVTDVSGLNMETLDAVAYSRTGCQTVAQLMGEDDENED